MKIDPNTVKFFKEQLMIAGKKVLEIYQTPFEVNYKEDKSPLTQADIIANEILINAIQKSFPNDFIVSEEVKISKNTSLPENFWLIDPIDGTKEFVNKTGDFTLNIGYIEKGFPIWGMVYAPIYQELYYGGRDYGIAFEKKNLLQTTTQTYNHNEIIALTSRNHFTPKEDTVLDQLKVTKKIPMGSSLKICKLAVHQADIYLRYGQTSEWDIAPADAILTASGGTIITQNLKRLTYGKPNLINPSFIALSNHYIQTNPDFIQKLKKIFNS